MKIRKPITEKDLREILASAQKDGTGWRWRGDVTALVREIRRLQRQLKALLLRKAQDLP